MAVHHGFDVVGIAILAVVTSLGGGILRDIVLGDAPLPASTRWEDLVGSSAAAVAFVAHPWPVRLGRPRLVFDAAGSGSSA